MSGGETAMVELVGRDDSLGVLQEALQQAAAGRPAFVLISGETGVGKTSLVEAFLRRARIQRLAGACVPVAGEPLPYAALSQALRAASATGVVRQELGRSPDLARLLPAPPVEEVAQRPTRNQGDETGSRLRLFQAVLGLLGRMSAAGPVVHVVEDLHWADRSTLDLLSFLATNLTNERVLVVLTYREGALSQTGGPASSLGPWLADFGRLCDPRRLRLERLDRGSATRLITTLLGEVPSPEFLERTLERSAGNPLFVEQLVRGGDEPETLPATLHELLRSRVHGLPDQTRRVLRAASVIGRGGSVSLLSRATGAAPEDVEDALRPAIEALVAEVRADDSIGFHHPAFREVVYAELLPGERTRLHRAAAEALTGDVEAASSDAGPEVIGEVARHWHRAGDLPRALDAAITAGAAYERMFAFADAHAAYARAIELLGQVPADLDRVDLMRRAADAASQVGETAAAVRLIRQALDDEEDARGRAALLERLGSFQYFAGDGVAAEAALREAVGLLDPDEKSTLAARIHAGLALYGAAWSRVDHAEADGTLALQLATATGGRREEGLALHALGQVAATRGDTDRGVELLGQALEIAREVGEANDLGIAYVDLSHVLSVAGRLDEGIDLGRQGIVELGRFGQDRQTGSLLMVNASDALIKAGRLPEAEELIDQALARHPRGIMAAPVLLLSARLTMALGELTTAWDRCEQARLVIESENAPVGWLREAIETAAEIELWAGRPTAAYDLVIDGLAAIRGTDDAHFGRSLVALGLRALADDDAVRRDAKSRSERAGRLAVLEAECDAVGELLGAKALPETAAWAALCDAETARLNVDRAGAGDLWAEVVEAWTAIDRPLPAAYARWREAEARLIARVDAASTASLRDAHAAALELRDARLTSEVESLATWYRVDLLPASDPAGACAGDDGALDAYGLTARELEVLTALAAGHTNREIADAMFISAKTASVHVSNILRKLDVTGRQEAARVAHRLGITG
ncbi:helix-turn-helix transcriptional regulator [Nocardioides speluncae]|uniref:helix-turn-helix transcriptional regulator n=1 Tax=Nocardioides speluncae TaxID=2670337 RepID=UPI001379A0F3|nr:helix-turn-helix transcriptional regulator [Nocardioides speluncae]